MKVEQGKKVKIEYELGIEGGDTIESSARRGPLEYVHGDGKMLPGLEKRIEGMSVGEERDGVIPPAEAYGTEESLPTLEIPRANFPKSEELEVGQPFEAKDASGNPIRFKVVAVDGDKVTVRLDHPLAGKAIRFRVKVLDVA